MKDRDTKMENVRWKDGKWRRDKKQEAGLMTEKFKVQKRNKTQKKQEIGSKNQDQNLSLDHTVLIQNTMYNIQSETSG